MKGMTVILFFILIHVRHQAKKYIIKFLATAVNSNGYKILVKPLALGAPSAILACYKIDGIKNNINSEIISFIDHNLLIIASCLFIVPVITGVEDLIKNKASKYSDDLSKEILFLLLTALESPVNQKMDRFLNELNTSNKKIDAGVIFKKITEPSKQIAEIIRSIHIFFTGWSSLILIVKKRWILQL